MDYILCHWCFDWQHPKHSSGNRFICHDFNIHLLAQHPKDQSGKLDATEKHLQLSSPETILKKGYTLTMKDGKVVKQHVDLKKGDSIKTVFYNGEIDSIVK